MKKYLILDIECDSLEPTKIWCAVTKDFQTKEKKVWYEVHKEEFNSYISSFIPVGHNLLGFDVPVLNDLWGSRIHYAGVVDTLVVSKLRNSWNYSSHSLADLGQRLGFPKIEFTDFSKLTQEMVDYCVQDVEITEKLFEKFLPFIQNPRFRKALELEHNSAYLCQQISKNGFKFDLPLAISLYEEILEELNNLLKGMQKDFRPKSYLIREVLPLPTAKGGINRKDFRFLEGTPEDYGFSVGAPFSLIEFRSFNPASPKQRIEVLNSCGWKPVDKTDGHIKAIKYRNEEKLPHFEVYGWKVNETNLKTLPEDAPEGAKKLAEYIVLDSRRSTIEEWFQAYKEDGRIHGNLHNIGAWTHRKAHSKPNLANIPRVVYEPKDRKVSIIEGININYNARMRECWTTDKLLVGTDAEGIQLRILAHLLENEEYTKAIVDGRKEDKTDVHNVNRNILGHTLCKDRDVSKTFIYAWILNAQAPKIAEILECKIPEAAKAMSVFMNEIEGLKELKLGKIPLLAKQGYFYGLDGRVVICDSEHKMLAGLLQCGESVVMKWANRIWYNRLTKEKIWFKQVDDVHDEWQTEVENDTEVANYVAKVQTESIRQAGEELGVKCKLDGSSVIGKNWKETH